MTGKGVLVQNIVWRKNGAVTSTRGNTYPVILEESKGGGNYTCYGEDGALLNHTLVLLRLEESKAGALFKIIFLMTEMGVCKCFSA